MSTMSAERLRELKDEVDERAPSAMHDDPWAIEIPELIAEVERQRDGALADGWPASVFVPNELEREGPEVRPTIVVMLAKDHRLVIKDGNVHSEGYDADRLGEMRWAYRYWSDDAAKLARAIHEAHALGLGPTNIDGVVYYGLAPKDSPVLEPGHVPYQDSQPSHDDARPPCRTPRTRRHGINWAQVIGDSKIGALVVAIGVALTACGLIVQTGHIREDVIELERACTEESVMERRILDAVDDMSERMELDRPELRGRP